MGAPSRVALVPPELLELVQARDLLGKLSLELSARVQELADRLERTGALPRPPGAALCLCEGLLRDCMNTWYALERALLRTCEAHRRLVARIKYGPALTEPMLVGLGEALLSLPDFFARAAQNQLSRGRHLLQHAATLERQAARRGGSLGSKLRAALGRFTADLSRDLSQQQQGGPGAPSITG